MAKAEVHAGVCGFTTIVETTLDGDVCKVSIQSECSAIQRLAQALTKSTRIRKYPTGEKRR